MRVGGVTSEALQAALARTSGLRRYRNESIQPEIVTLIPPRLARRLRAVP
jgi:hypothetical protein